VQPQDINILYAEDSTIVSMAVMNILRHLGYDFKHVTNGADALREYNFGSYQLVLCDHNMGKDMITGLEVLQALRNSGDDVPFILGAGLDKG
jgi:CheY-like chemotaxis protein